MSRHDYRTDTARLSIGWDAPLATFFLQVWTGDIDDEDASPAIWLGGFYGEARQPDPLIAVARRHIPDLPATIHRQLTVDDARPTRRDRRYGWRINLGYRTRASQSHDYCNVKIGKGGRIGSMGHAQTLNSVA